MNMFCEKCGAQMLETDRFCINCGASPSGQAPVTASVATLEKPPKKRGGKGLVIGLIVAVLVVALAVGAYFALQYLDDSREEPDDKKTDSVHQTTAPNQVQATEPSAAQTEKVELVVNGAVLEYTLTDADVEEFYDLLETSEEMALAGEDMDAIEEITNQLDDKYAYLEEQYSIAMVLYYCNLNDEAASERYLECTEIVTQANNDYLEMARRIYLSDSPAKDMLFEDWTEEDIAMLMAYTPEIMELQQRNSEIEVAYQDMQDSDTMYEDMVPLYLEMVQNNNRIAQIYGYDNYYVYAYEMVYDRDYGSEEIQAMRRYVSTYMPSAINGAMSEFVDSMGELSYQEQTTLSGFLFDAYDDGYESYLTGYFGALPAQAREDMLDMFNGNILMMDDVDGAMEGAFTTTVGDDRMICFFGPGYSGPMTVVHEVGHYYGGQYGNLDEIPLDLAETQSQGNEWLFMAYLEEELDSDVYEALVDYRMYSDMVTITICVIVDEFEERVYTHPNIASLTSDDLDAIMAEVCESYGGISYLGTVATDVQSYWRLVVIEQPVYYISYGVSAIAAMNVYTIAEEDFGRGVEAYCSLNEGMDIDKGFLGNITAAGLSGPFDEEVYRNLQKMYND